MSRLRKIVSRRSVRLEQHGVLVSKVLARPGPTHSIVDGLAAAVRVLARGPRMVLLGFAGGGILGPLRALGVEQEVLAVDISRAGYGLFKRLCGSWAAPWRWHQAEAGAWLRAQNRPFHVVVEDLSVAVDGDVVKPDLIWTSLPALIRRRLAANGIAIFNLLRPSRTSWKGAVHRVVRPFRSALVLHFKDFENRVVLAGNGTLPARRISIDIHTALRCLGSRLAGRISVRTFHPGRPDLW